jgi:tetratricopeptide (TPR) repeat protein
LKPIEGTRVRRLRVKKDQREDEEVVELREIQSAIARNRTHLADQMLAKGRPVAALNEYQRALQASPQSPVILNKLGRVLDRANRFDEAVALLKKASTSIPTAPASCAIRTRLLQRKFSRSAQRSRRSDPVESVPPADLSLIDDVYAACDAERRARRKSLWTASPRQIGQKEEPENIMEATEINNMRSPRSKSSPPSATPCWVRSARSSSAKTGSLKKS